MSSLFFFFLCTVAFSAGKSIVPNFFTNYPGFHDIRDSSTVQIPYDTYNNVIKPGQYQDIFKFTIPDTDKLTWTDLYKNKIPELEKETLKRSDFIQVPHPLTSMKHMHPYGMKTVEGPMGIVPIARTEYPELEKETLKRSDFIQVPHPLTSMKYMHPYGMKTVEGPMGIIPIARTEYPELEKETLKRSDFIQVPQSLTSMKYMHPYGMKFVEGRMGIIPVARTEYPEWIPTHHRYHKKDDFDRYTFGYGGLDSRMAYKNKWENPLEKVGTYKYIDADGKLKIVQYATAKPGFNTVTSNNVIPMMPHHLMPVKMTVDMKQMKDQKIKYDLSDETTSYLKNRLDSMEDESYEMPSIKAIKGELPSMMYTTNKMIIPDIYTVSGMVHKPFTYSTMQEPSFRTQNQVPHYVQYPYGIPMLSSKNYEVSPRTLFKV